jgi:hypothetical protein
MAKSSSRRNNVRIKRITTILPALAVLACLTVATAKMQEPAKPQAEANHFAKDGLSFDYPTGWAMRDESTAQMQVLELSRGDHIIRVRAPREWLKTPAKEAEAKRLIHEKYVNDFNEMLLQGGLRPTRTNATSEFGGGPAEGTKLRAMLDGAPGGMDAFYRVLSDRFVQISQIGSERDMVKSAAAWDLIRLTIKVEPPAAPGSTPAPAKKTP